MYFRKNILQQHFFKYCTMSIVIVFMYILYRATKIFVCDHGSWPERRHGLTRAPIWLDCCDLNDDVRWSTKAESYQLELKVLELAEKQPLWGRTARQTICSFHHSTDHAPRPCPFFSNNIRQDARQCFWDVFGPPGSGSFYHQAKIVRKTLIPTVLLLLFDFLSLNNDVHVPSKNNKQKKFFLKLAFCWPLEGQWRK